MPAIKFSTTYAKWCGHPKIIRQTNGKDFKTFELSDIMR